MKIEIKKLYEKAIVPKRGSDYAAGYDLYACVDSRDGIEDIPPHGTVKIGTGIACAVPEGFFGAIFARSGLATKEGLRPANCVGVVDCDYRGEIVVAIHNDGDSTKYIKDNERIAQLVILPYQTVEFEEVEDLPETVRGSGGFGSTGNFFIDVKVPEKGLNNSFVDLS